MLQLIQNKSTLNYQKNCVGIDQKALILKIIQYKLGLYNLPFHTILLASHIP